MQLPQYHESMIDLPLTKPLADLPSKIKAQTEKQKEGEGVCYLLPEPASNIRYFLEYDTGYDKEGIWQEYGILALYTFKNNQRLLVDLENDIYNKDIEKFDSIIRTAGVLEQVDKNSLTKFCAAYWFSNGYNARDRFERLLDSNYEGDKINKIEQLTDDYSRLLGW